MGEHLRTEFAMKAMDLAELFNVLVGEAPIAAAAPGQPPFAVELSAPDGMSTGGGVQAVQHIKLVPVGGGATLVAGTANQAEGTAELRSYDHLSELHAKRFKGAEAPVDRAAYADLLKRAESFFSEKGLRVVLVDTARAPAGAAPASRRGGLMLALVGVVALVGGVLFFMLGRK
jgi:hypothetical protein